MQYLPVPVACYEDPDIPLLAPGDLGDSDVCALAIDIPAISAATAVKVVSVFIKRLLMCGSCRIAARPDNRCTRRLFRELTLFWEKF